MLTNLAKPLPRRPLAKAREARFVDEGGVMAILLSKLLSLRVFRRGLFAHRFSFRANLAVGFAPRVRKQIEDSWRRLMQTSPQVVHHEGEQVRCSRCVGKVVITRKQFCGPLLGYAASIPRISSQEILVMRFVCSLRWHRYS